MMTIFIASKPDSEAASGLELIDTVSSNVA